MAPLIELILLGYGIIITVCLTKKLQAIEDDLRAQLQLVSKARDVAEPKTKIHFQAQVRVFERLLRRHFPTED